MKETASLAVTIAGHTFPLTRMGAAFLSESLDAALQVPEGKTVKFTHNGSNSGGVSIRVERSALPRSGTGTVTDC